MALCHRGFGLCVQPGRSWTEREATYDDDFQGCVACKSRWSAGCWSRSGGQDPFNVKAGGVGPQRSGGSSNSRGKHGGVEARGAAAGCSSLWRLSPDALFDDGKECHGVLLDTIPS